MAKLEEFRLSHNTLVSGRSFQNILIAEGQRLIFGSSQSPFYPQQIEDTSPNLRS